MSHLDLDLTPNQCRWLRQLRYIRRARGWSAGWLRHAFVERWGFEPPVLDSDMIEFPDPNVVAFVKAKLGAFLRDQDVDEATIDLRLEQFETDIASYDPS